jgi:hypothetical protein
VTLLIVMIAVAIGVAMSGWAVWLMVRHHRERSDWNPLGHQRAARMSLLGTMPCVDCLGDLGQCRPWCVRAGGRGDNLHGDRDARCVDDQDRQVTRRARRRAVLA